MLVNVTVIVSRKKGGRGGGGGGGGRGGGGGGGGEGDEKEVCYRFMPDLALSWVPDPAAVKAAKAIHAHEATGVVGGNGAGSGAGGMFEGMGGLGGGKRIGAKGVSDMYAMLE